jgi:hypothetical protein
LAELGCLTADPCRLLDFQNRVDSHVEERAENGSDPGENCRIICLHDCETTRAVPPVENGRIQYALRCVRSLTEAPTRLIVNAGAWSDYEG